MTKTLFRSICHLECLQTIKIHQQYIKQLMIEAAESRRVKSFSLANGILLIYSYITHPWNDTIYFFIASLDVVPASLTYLT